MKWKMSRSLPEGTSGSNGDAAWESLDVAQDTLEGKAMVAVAGGLKAQSDEVVFSLAEVFGFIFIAIVSHVLPCCFLVLAQF